MSQNVQSGNARTLDMVVAAQDSCGILISAVREHGPAVAAVVEGDIAGVRPPADGTPDASTGTVMPMLDGLTDLLGDRLDSLVDTSRTLFAAHAASASATHERGEATAELSNMIRGVRDTFKWNYPDLNIGELGLEGRAAQDTTPAIHQAERVARKLREIDLSKERAVFQHQKLDPLLFAADLEGAAERAELSLASQRAVGRQVEAAVSEKNAAHGVYQKIFVRVARMFEDLCRLAGKDDLAEKVRPSTRRPGTLANLPEPDEPSSEA